MLSWFEYVHRYTGCSLNIVFFSSILKYIFWTLVPSVYVLFCLRPFPRCQYPCTPPRVAWWQLGHPMMLQSCRQYLIITLYIILSYKYINQHLEYEHTFICAIVHINTLLIVSVELICTAWYPPVYRTLVQSPVHHPGKRIIRQDAEYDFFVVGWNRYEVLKCRVSKKLT